MGTSSGSRVNNIYSPGSDKVPDVQLYMSTSCQLGIREIRAFSDIEKPLLYSDLAVKAVKSENNKKAFQRQRMLGLAATYIRILSRPPGE